MSDSVARVMTNSRTVTDPQERIILALDVPNFSEAQAWIDRLPEVKFWKVGLQLFVADGQRVLNYLREQEKRIFLDLKLHDIPNTVARACASALIYQVDFLTVHISGGKTMLQQAQAVVQNSATKLLGITVLTSLTDVDLACLKVSMTTPEYVQHLAQIAQELGLAGVVCSPQELAVLRSMFPSPFLLVTPGIRLEGDAAGDQHRYGTPSQAFSQGADYIVVGRSVLGADHPELAWASLCASISL